MSDHDARLLRSLLRWNRCFVALLILGALFLGARWKMRDIRELKVSWFEDGSLKLHSASDGPVVVTHLALPGDGGIGVRVTAILTPPLAYIDSSGASLSAAQVERLVWRDKYNQRISAPAPGAPLAALYYEPQIAQPDEPKP